MRDYQDAYDAVPAWPVAVEELELGDGDDGAAAAARRRPGRPSGT